MIGDIPTSSPVSSYNPSEDVMKLTMEVRKDWSNGIEILNKPWVELNNRSVIDDMNRGQMTYNAYVDESVEDPSEAWKWRGTRSKARNKAIALHAQLTAGYIIPMFMAQNDDDEEDVDFSNIMRDVSEWMVHNSNYKTSFLGVTMGMLMNPVNYLGAEYAEVFQKVKTKTEQGFETKEVLDEVLSGFNAPVYSADQILISNAFEQNIQKQRVIIKRRYIDYAEAKTIYGHHPNFVHVTAGIQTLYSDEDGRFYDVKDEDHPFLVEEATPEYRGEDLEAPFINGIYMGDDDVEANPIKHRDHRGTPKYNVVPFGYQRVNEHFFYYKSLMNSMYWDNLLIDAQYELGMNRAFLDTNMPIAITGTDKIDSEVIFPSAVVAIQDKDVDIKPLLPAANLGSMFNAMKITEESMEEGSISDVGAGQLPDANQKATAIALANRNTKTQLLGVGKTLAESVVQFGGLMADIAVNNLSVPEIEQMLGGQDKLKYRTFILNNKTVDGKSVSKILKFDESLLGSEFTEDEIQKKNLELLTKVGFPDNNQHLALINPELFAKMKYLTRVEPEKMFPQNEEFIQATSVAMYQLLRNDPLIQPEELIRKVTEAFYRGESEDFIAKKSDNVMQTLQNLQNPEAKPEQPQLGNNALNKATSSNLPTGQAVGLA